MQIDNYSNVNYIYDIEFFGSQDSLLTLYDIDIDCDISSVIDFSSLKIKPDNLDQFCKKYFQA